MSSTNYDISPLFVSDGCSSKSSATFFPIASGRGGFSLCTLVFSESAARMELRSSWGSTVQCLLPNKIKKHIFRNKPIL